MAEAAAATEAAEGEGAALAAAYSRPILAAAGAVCICSVLERASAAAEEEAGEARGE